MLQGVLDAAERLAAVGLPPGSRVRAFFLKAPHSFSEVAAKSEVSRDSIVKLCQLIFYSALLSRRETMGRHGARLCKPAGMIKWSCSRTVDTTAAAHGTRQPEP